MEDKIQRSKEVGGLGVGKLKHNKWALLCKWRWRFKVETNALWVKVIKAFYGGAGGLELEGNISGGVWGK